MNGLCADERPTERQRWREKCLQHVGTPHEDMIPLLLGVTPRTAKQFIEMVKAGKVDEACRHGNRGRREYQEAYEALRAALAEGGRDFQVSVERFRECMAEDGVPVPAPRTVRHWLRSEFGIRRRRWRRRRRA